MVCTVSDLSKWESFPKGLRVLLLDRAGNSASDIRSKLESMDYIVTVFTDENEALSAVSKKPESFHIAIVEVNTGDKNESFKFLEAVKNLPTIMTSSVNCLSTTMKCIALGAVEFLHKPLSGDKLKNIWQHVVHKAFSDGGSTVSESLKPVKESVVSILHLELENRNENPDGKDNINMTTDEKDPAPSTPQLKQGSRLMDDGDCQENANCSMENVNSSIEKENVEDQDVGESKSVETTNCTSGGNRGVVKEEEGEMDDVKSDNTDSLYLRKKEDGGKDSCRSDHPVNKPSGIKNGSGNKPNRKKVDWTPELHKRFVQAVEQLGIDQAIPSRILELMKVEGLTRHNVASHLQKFRMHRRNILPKDDHDQRWIQPRDNHHHLHRQMHRSCNGYLHRPIMAYPANLAAPPVYPVWGLPGVHLPGGPPRWPPSGGYSPWQPADGWHWKPPYQTMHGNAWGYPVGTPGAGPCHTSQNLPSGFDYSVGTANGFKIPPSNSFNFHPDEEVIDNVVKEAISKPRLPLPLGLKPPSVESVLAELSRQGISAVPSCPGNAARFH